MTLLLSFNNRVWKDWSFTFVRVGPISGGNGRVPGEAKTGTEEADQSLAASSVWCPS